MATKPVTHKVNVHGAPLPKQPISDKPSQGKGK